MSSALSIGGAIVNEEFVLKVKQFGRSYVPVPPAFGDAGVDLIASEPQFIKPGEWASVPTGVAFEFPPNYVGLVHPRSGMAAKYGITVLNAPGTIDSGYRGEIKVILINHSTEPYDVLPGDKIAQVVFQHYSVPRIEVVGELSDSERGVGGFGSTGR